MLDLNEIRCAAPQWVTATAQQISFKSELGNKSYCIHFALALTLALTLIRVRVRVSVGNGFGIGARVGVNLTPY